MWLKRKRVVGFKDVKAKKWLICAESNMEGELYSRENATMLDLR